MTIKDLSISTAHAKEDEWTLSGRIMEFVTATAQAWQLSLWIVFLILLIPVFVMLIGASSALFGKDVYLLVTGEDGIAENFQVLVYIVTFILALTATLRYWQAKERFIALLYIILCVGLIFLTGEEISWGQRIFGWGTTGIFAEINQQQETNLHNIKGVHDLFKWIQLLVGAYGVFLPLIVKRWAVFPLFRNLLAAITPPAVLIPYFGAMFLWKLYRNLLPAPGPWEFRLAEYNEVLELVLALGLFLFMVFQLRRNRRSINEH